MAEDVVTRSDEAASVADTGRRRALTEKEKSYMRGGIEPAASSILTSTSKYLNNPYYRDTFAQFALRRMGDDLPPTYLIPEMVRALSECRDDAEFFALVQEERAKRPDFAAWLDRRRLTVYDPEQLRRHPAGTLGAMIRAFIEDSGYDIQFMKAGLAPANDLEYMIKRRVSHHDIEHMVTGFGPNALGETALAVMNNVSILNYFSPPLAAYLNEANMFITASGIFRASLHTPQLMLALYEAWALAIEAGKAIRKPLLMIDWEDYLDWTPDEIAADLGFRRGPGEGWAWSSAAAGFKG